MGDKWQEMRRRRQADRLGLKIIKSRRSKFITPDDFGQWQIVNHRNFILAGERFELTLEQVGEYLDSYAARLMGVHHDAAEIAAKAAQVQAPAKSEQQSRHTENPYKPEPKTAEPKDGGKFWEVSIYGRVIKVEAPTAEAAAEKVAAGAGTTPDRLKVFPA